MALLRTLLELCSLTSNEHAHGKRRYVGITHHAKVKIVDDVAVRSVRDENPQHP